MLMKIPFVMLSRIVVPSPRFVSRPIARRESSRAMDTSNLLRPRQLMPQSRWQALKSLDELSVSTMPMTRELVVVSVEEEAEAAEAVALEVAVAEEEVVVMVVEEEDVDETGDEEADVDFHLLTTP
jgi:2-methylaconitate cis-trans-isomerase PrpF